MNIQVSFNFFKKGSKKENFPTKSLFFYEKLVQTLDIFNLGKLFDSVNYVTLTMDKVYLIDF